MRCESANENERGSIGSRFLHLPPLCFGLAASILHRLLLGRSVSEGYHTKGSVRQVGYENEGLNQKGAMMTDPHSNMRLGERDEALMVSVSFSVKLLHSILTG